MTKWVLYDEGGEIVSVDADSYEDAIEELGNEFYNGNMDFGTEEEAKEFIKDGVLGHILELRRL